MMQDIIINIMNSWGYLGVFLLIAIENIFPPIPSEVILLFGGFMTTYAGLSIIGMIIGVLEMIGIILLFMFLINFGNYEETTDSTIENINNVYDNSLIEL